jgi:hypothetical protein
MRHIYLFLGLAYNRRVWRCTYVWAQIVTGLRVFGVVRLSSVPFIDVLRRCVGHLYRNDVSSIEFLRYARTVITINPCTLCT